MAGRLFFAFTIALTLLLNTSTPSHAVIQGLNGQTGQQQTFSNDSNIIISSLNNVHALQWAGLLPISRGGTGTGSFTDGSIPFIDNDVFGEDNDNLYWDNVNKRLGIGTNQPEATIHAPAGLILLDQGGGITLRNVPEAGAGQNIQFQDNTSYPVAQIAYEPLELGDFGSLVLSTNGLGAGGIGISSRNGNTVVSGSPASYPEPQELFQVLEDIGKPSTLMIGANDLLDNETQDSVGCLAMADTDGDGVTWVTANDGVLTASATRPSICELPN
jgi:hypothetical protein